MRINQSAAAVTLALAQIIFGSFASVAVAQQSRITNPLANPVGGEYQSYFSQGDDQDNGASGAVRGVNYQVGSGIPTGDSAASASIRSALNPALGASSVTAPAADGHTQKSAVGGPTHASAGLVDISGNCVAGLDCDQECCDEDVCCENCGSKWCTKYCAPFSCHHNFFTYAEFLSLRVRNAEVAYASAINGPITAPPVAGVEVAPTAVVDQFYNPGFRVGLGMAFENCCAISAQYTFFETSNRDFQQTNAPDVIRSLVSHPEILTAGGDFLQAAGFSRIELDLVDVDFRNWFLIGENYAVAWLAGARYAHLDQIFTAGFFLNGAENVYSQLTFDGAGIRVGLEGERVGESGMLVYGKSAASFVVGEFEGAYQQASSFDPRQVTTSWEGGRLVSILDLEIGVGWTSACRTWRISAGYLASGWFNMVKNDDFIQSVRRNNWIDLSDVISFDGWAARLEWRF